jgi:hypothetical protein
MRRLRLLAGILLLGVIVPTSTLGATTNLGATPVVTVDNSAGNVIASGGVVKSDPNAALVTVTNGYHFWVAADLQPAVGGASLRPASLFEDVGGLFAAGGLIAPSGTAAWDGKFDIATGGSQAVRLHYELTSAGGAAALAANLLTIIADSLGASTSVATPASLMKALTLVTDLPNFVDLVHAVQRGDLWDFVSTVEVLLQSGTGRATLREALSGVGVVASDERLLQAGSVVGVIDWAWTLIDMMRSSLGDHFDGTVTFAVAGQTYATPMVSPSQPVVGPPAAPQGATMVDTSDLTPCVLAFPESTAMGCEVISWLPPEAVGTGGAVSGYHLYNGQTHDSCSGDAICVPVYTCPPTTRAPAQLLATVPGGIYSTYLDRSGTGGGCPMIAAFNSAGESIRVPVAYDDSWQGYVANTYSVDYPGTPATADVPTTIGGPYAITDASDSSAFVFGAGANRMFYAVDRLTFSGAVPRSDAGSVSFFAQLLAAQDRAGSPAGSASAPSAQDLRDITLANCSGTSANTGESCPGFAFDLAVGGTYESFEIISKGNATYVVMAAGPDSPTNRRDASICLMTFRPNDWFS